MYKPDLITASALRKLMSDVEGKEFKIQGSLSTGATSRLQRYAHVYGGKTPAQLGLQLLEDYLRSPEFEEKLAKEEAEYLLSRGESGFSPDE